MARLYEMCNDIDSKDILQQKERLTAEEKRRLIANVKKEGIISGNQKKKKSSIGKTAGWVAAAAVVILVVVPNISAEAAYAMGQIPILGSVIKAVTVREYHYEDEQFSAQIQEVQLERETDGQKEQEDDIDITAGESIAVINESIEEMTDRLIARFEEQVETGEGHSGVYADHEIVTDTDTWFTLRINVTEVAASGMNYQYYYHIDKTTGEIATLKDLFEDGADYITVVSENIKKQMKEKMAEDDSIIYWVDTEEELGHQFEQIKEDQNFYLSEDGQIVICFDEYEVAPGYMGLVQFTVEDEAVADIRK